MHKLKFNGKLRIRDSYVNARVYEKRYQAKAYKKHANLLKDEINKEDNIENIRMIRPHPFLKAETRRIIKLLPKFSLGLRNGKPIKVPFTILIIFHLQ